MAFSGLAKPKLLQILEDPRSPVVSNKNTTSDNVLCLIKPESNLNVSKTQFVNKNGVKYVCWNDKLIPVVPINKPQTTVPLPPNSTRVSKLTISNPINKTSESSNTSASEPPALVPTSNKTIPASNNAAKTQPHVPKKMIIQSKVVKISSEDKNIYYPRVHPLLPKNAAPGKKKPPIRHGKYRSYKEAVEANKDALLDICMQLRADYQNALRTLRRTRKRLSLSEKERKRAVKVRNQLEAEVESMREKIKQHESFIRPKPVQSKKTQTDAAVEAPRVEEAEAPAVTMEDNLLDLPIELLDQNGKGSILLNDVNMGYHMERPVPIVQKTNDSVEEEIRKRIMYIGFMQCDVMDPNGDYPIHIAVLRNDLQGVRRQIMCLKWKQVSLDLFNDDELTPLHIAMMEQDVSERIIMELINNGANFSTKNYSGYNFFHLGAKHGTLAKLSKLLTPTSEPEWKAIDDYDWNGFTALMVAVMEKNREVAVCLLDWGASVDLHDKKSGRTALFHAVDSQSLDLVDLLLKRGADRDSTNYLGQTVSEVVSEMETMPAMQAIFARDIELPGVQRAKKQARGPSPASYATSNKRQRK